MKIWTATTDGDGCDLTTTVHASMSEAEKRVRADLGGESRAAWWVTGYTLRYLWETRMDGACIIQEHEVEAVEKVA